MATLYFNGAVDNDWNTLGNWWEDDQFTVAASALPTSSDSVVTSAIISSNSGSNPTIVNFTVNGNIYINIDLTVSGMATFNNESILGQIIGSSKFINGNATFNNTSILLGTINGNATFNNSAICAISSSVSANAEFNDSSIKRGNVSGTITWNSSYPSDGSLTYYFNGAVDNDWNTIGNWWIDIGFSLPITTYCGLPQNIDSVIVSANITSNSGSTPTVKNFTITDAQMSTDIVITNSATFNGSSSLGNGVGATILEMTNSNATTTFNNTSFIDSVGGINIFTNVGTGSVIFNDSSFIKTGTINANTTFNDNSALGVGGTVGGDATFNDSSIKRGTVTGTITWSSSNPSNYSLIYYYNAATNNDWATLGNWWINNGLTVPINSGIGLPTNIDTVYILDDVTSNSESTPTVKNLYVGDNSYANVSFDISINVNNSATFNNGAKFAYNGNNSLLLNENKTVTFNSDSECYGAINSIDGTSLVNIVIDSAFVGSAFAPWGSLRGNIILQGNLPSISSDSLISTGSTLTINSGYFYYASSPRVPTNFTNITIVVNNDRPLGPSSSNYDSNITSTMFSSCNITFNDTSYSSASLNINLCSLTFNDDSYNRAYYGEYEAYYGNNGSILNTYQFNNNSHNYGFIALPSNVTWNNGKGINGSSILGLI